MEKQEFPVECKDKFFEKEMATKDNRKSFLKL